MEVGRPVGVAIEFVPVHYLIGKWVIVVIKIGSTASIVIPPVTTILIAQAHGEAGLGARPELGLRAEVHLGHHAGVGGTRVGAGRGGVEERSATRTVMKQSLQLDDFRGRDSKLGTDGARIAANRTGRPVLADQTVLGQILDHRTGQATGLTARAAKAAHGEREHVIDGPVDEGIHHFEASGAFDHDIALEVVLLEHGRQTGALEAEAGLADGVIAIQAVASGAVPGLHETVGNHLSLFTHGRTGQKREGCERDQHSLHCFPPLNRLRPQGPSFKPSFEAAGSRTPSRA